MSKGREALEWVTDGKTAMAEALKWADDWGSVQSGRAAHLLVDEARYYLSQLESDRDELRAEVGRLRAEMLRLRDEERRAQLVVRALEGARE